MRWVVPLYEGRCAKALECPVGLRVNIPTKPGSAPARLDDGVVQLVERMHGKSEAVGNARCARDRVAGSIPATIKLFS